MTALHIFSVFFLLKITQGLAAWFLRVLNRCALEAHPRPPELLAGVLDETAYRRSQEYTLAKLRFSDAHAAFELILLFAFISLGGFTWLESLTLRMTDPLLLQGWLFFFALAAGKGILDLPFDYYFSFHLEARFGFNRMTVRTWIGDAIKQVLLSLLIGSPLIFFLLFVMQQHPHSFWWIGFLGFFGFQVFLLWIYPTVIAPWFNRFSPLKEGPVRERLLDLVKRLGFTVSGIFVMDGSKRSGHANAYFTGFGRGRRIVLYDTLVESLSPDALEGVMAHEMGHYRLKHIHKHLLLSSLALFALFYFFGVLYHREAFYEAFGLHGTSRFASLVLFPLFLEPLLFWMTPFWHAVSRRHEYDADAFAAFATKQSEPLAQALLTLSRDNLSNLTPHSLYSFFHYSHPTLMERITALRRLSGEGVLDGNTAAGGGIPS